MDTQIRTPQAIFLQPQRLIVPLFQRPYVWTRDGQWEPLWLDVVRLAERLLGAQSSKVEPHFLGAVVLQQTTQPTGSLQHRTVIDGQQRLTTLQLLLDALHAEFVVLGATQSAARLHPLVTNQEAFCEKPEDRFKVWPTNKDRPAFNAVMGAAPPVEYDKIELKNERLVTAHRFFAEQARGWMHAGASAIERANALEKAARELLQMVVIDLTADENAQEIFETLNARGAPLSAADLIKNFVFQRAAIEGAQVDHVYETFWREFETGFWETEISAGRTLQPRVSVFLNHWLTSKTGEEIVAREVFSRFKRYALREANKTMELLLSEVDRAATVYRDFVKDAEKKEGRLDRRGLFAYRSAVLESETVKPLVLTLLDPEQAPVPLPQLEKAFDVLESWLVRRMLVRATTKGYSRFIPELVKELRGAAREVLGDVLENRLKLETSDALYWPDDAELRRELESSPIYRRLGRGRLRMVLEAIEDSLRGYQDGKSGLGGQRVDRGTFAIEHVMPQKWEAHWPLEGETRDEREERIHTLGNLTLLHQRLNSTVSNAGWDGPKGKRAAIHQYDPLFLNRNFPDVWNAKAIDARTRELVSAVLATWPVPRGHKSALAQNRPILRRKVELIDLMSAGLLVAGATLHARAQDFRGRTATLLADGRIDVNGQLYTSLTGAAQAISGRVRNGWYFFSADAVTRRPLAALWRSYVDNLSGDLAKTDEPDDA